MLDLRPVPEAELSGSRDKLLTRAAARLVRTSFEGPEPARASASGMLERSADALRFYDLVEAGRAVGWLVWWHRGDQCEVNDLLLDEPARGEELLPALIALAGGEGCPAVGTAWVGHTPVGMLWISTERPMAFVYDIEVREDQRRQGYGEAMMNAGARWCRDLGHPALGLNVFGHNPKARALYDKLGYHVTRDYRTHDLVDGSVDGA